MYVIMKFVMLSHACDQYPLMVSHEKFKRGIINDFRWHFAYVLIIYCKNIIRPFLFIFFSRTTTSGDWVDWHTNRHLHSAGNCTKTIIFINALCYINHLTNTQYINLFYLDVFLKKKFIPLKKSFFSW